MIRKCFGWTYTFLFLSFFSFAQNDQGITGQVTAEGGGAAIPNCSIFINNTSRGTVSNATGSFELLHIPAGKHDLICSSIGYETIVYSFTEKDLPLRLNIHLKLKSTELEAVTVAPFLKNGWKEWGKFFLDNFIGTDDNATHCSIKNTKTIRFRFSQKNNLLSAQADQALIIENKALGYTITYQLEEFSYDFRSKVIIYLGYPLFTEMKTDRKKLKERWVANRRNAYLGSTMHFVKCLYNNRLEREGFEIRPIVTKENIEKKRIRAKFKLALEESRQITDSSAYFERILGQPDAYDFAGAPVTTDSIVSVNDRMEKTLFFQGKISVRFTYEVGSAPHQSTISLTTPAPIQIEANGNYYPPQELFTTGYWSYKEKLSNLLPLDE